jgi:type III restriction enzyme
MTNPKENAITLEDFQDKKIVLISDEAHHINASTKNAGKQLKLELDTWEDSIRNILHSSSDNLMLEFTATVDLQHEHIAAKYQDKLLYDYNLKQFRENGFSKEVIVRQVDSPPLERMLQAAMLSQYRYKLAADNGLHIKPVILMKSDKIDASKQNQQDFSAMITNLNQQSIEKLHQSCGKDDMLRRACDYFFVEKQIDYRDFIRELQHDFSDDKIINVNDTKEAENHQILLNSLESYHNQIRVIFAVDKLNEGWDVLNLFDIVRLYDKRDSKGDKAGKTTMSEAQLIGRGARYCPFIAPELQDMPKDKRKYDADLTHPLRFLEEIYYHSAHNPRYVDELTKALITTGMLPENERKVMIQVKDSFKSTRFYESHFLYANEQQEHKHDEVMELGYYLETREANFNYPYEISGRITERAILNQDSDAERIIYNKDVAAQDFALKDWNKSLIRRALDNNQFFTFDRLKQYFPHIDATRYFVEVQEYLEKVKVKVRGTATYLSHLNPSQKLDIVQYILQEMQRSIQQGYSEYKGTKDFKPKMIKDLITDKWVTKRIEGEAGKGWNKTTVPEAQKIALANEQWFVFNDNYGTEEEKRFICFVHEHKEQIKARFNEFYLIRNEKFITLYDFDTGKGFEPDFILMLQEKQSQKEVVYQIFIEPKGKHLASDDHWKQEFLLLLEKESRLAVIFEHKDYSIKGLPFYMADATDKKQNQDFTESFNGLLNDAT